MASIRLGDLLVKAKVISDSQLKAALAEQQKWGGKLGELLVRMNFLTEDMLVKALSKQMNVPAVNLESVAGVPPHARRGRQARRRRAQKATGIANPRVPRRPG